MRIRTEDAVTLGYLGCVTSLVILFHERIDGAWIYPLIHLAWGGAVLAVIWLASRSQHPFWIHLRNWYHLISIPLAFRELHYLVHPINPKDLDPLFVQWDLALFGAHPTVWIERWMHPWVTEYLQIVYSSFYFLPVILGVLLWRRQNWEGFRTTMVGVVTAFYLSYLGYFLFPALGPRFEIAHLQTAPLEGLWLTQPIRNALDHLELIQRDAFPSGHTGVSLLVLYYARRFLPQSFLPFLVVVASLGFSTVYLRYHYVVDVLAGVILAVASGWLAQMLRGRIEGKAARGLPVMPGPLPFQAGSRDARGVHLQASNAMDGTGRPERRERFQGSGGESHADGRKADAPAVQSGRSKIR
jgi:membrane-associated phospholipid phosphatase